MSKWLLPGVLLLAFTLLGCDSQKLMNLFVPADATKAGQTFLEDIRTGSFGPIQAAVDPVYRSQLNGDVLKQVQALFGGEPVKSVKIVGSRSLKTPNFTRYVVTYEYELGKRWVAAEIILQPANGHLQIEGIHAQQMDQSFERLNAFTLSGKTPVHLIFLSLAILIPIFVIYTAIICWRTPIPREKWLWRILVLVGVTGFTLNWTTGDVQYLPIHADLLGAGFNQQLFGPVILEVSLPLGALAFWFRRRKWLNEAEAKKVPPASNS